MQRLPPGAASGPAAPGAAAAGGPGGSSAAAGGSRGLGPALLAVLDYLKVLQGPPFVAQQVRVRGKGGGGGTGLGWRVAW